jgi:hypothetical protein
MVSIYRTYSGVGIFTFEDGYGVKVPFTLECSTDGNVNGLINPGKNDWPGLHQRLSKRARVKGQVTGPAGQVILSSILLLGFHMSLPGTTSFNFVLTGEMRIIFHSIPENATVTLRFGLINCFFLPSKAIVTSSGWSARKMPLLLRGKELEFFLVSDYSTLRHRLSLPGARELTAEALVPCRTEETNLARQALTDATLLISFALGTWVAIAYVDTMLEDKTFMSEIWPTKVYPYHDEPLLDARSPEDLARFLETGVEPLNTFRDKLKLGFALEYCILCKLSPAVQVKFIVIFIAMEALLERLQNLMPQTKKRPMSQAEGAGRRFLVLERLQMALQYYGVEDRFGVSNKTASPNFEEIRNRLAHSGDFPKGVDQVKSLRILEDIYQQLLLAILEYSGEYNDCTQAPIVKRTFRATPQNT